MEDVGKCWTQNLYPRAVPYLTSGYDSTRLIVSMFRKVVVHLSEMPLLDYCGLGMR